MNLLMITFDPPQNVGGIEGRVRNYATNLTEMGHSVRIISVFPDGDYTKSNLLEVPVLALPSSGRKLLKSLRSTFNEISKNSIDGIFIISGALTLYGVLLLSYSRLCGIRTLVLYYGKDILSSRKSRLASFALWISPKLAWRIVTNSIYTSSLLPKKYSRKVNVLYPSVDPGITKEVTEQRKSNRMVILFVGRLVARKGVDDLLRAFKIVLATVPDCALEIVGDGPEMTSLQNLSQEIGISENVRFCGKLYGPNLYNRYAMCDVFVMPSKTTEVDTEGFGTVFLEAAVFGKPSVGTMSGGIPEAVVGNVTGILVPESDSNSLSRALVSLLTNPKLTEDLGRSAKQRALDEFTWKKSSELLISLFK